MDDPADRVTKLEAQLAALTKRVNLLSIMQALTLLSLSLLGIAFSLRNH